MEISMWVLGIMFFAEAITAIVLSVCLMFALDKRDELVYKIIRLKDENAELKRKNESLETQLTIEKLPKILKGTKKSDKN